MNAKDFDNISIRGRVAYIILCFERYVIAKYPDADWTRVDDMMWKICDESDYIDNSAYKYMEIIPEYLYEFSDYESADFEYLSKEDYEYYISVIPKDDEKLNTIMHAVYSVTMEYAYSALIKYAPDTREYIDAVLDVMNKAELKLPDIRIVEQYVFDQYGGWGDTFDGRYLSSILNPNNN